jgi:hypothetical protein
MGVAGGPNIERDGLVFGYDTGYGVADNSTATRFYPGEPTVNSLNNSIIGTGNGASLGSDDFGTYIQLADQTTSYSRFQIPAIPVSSNETYTWSFELYSQDTITQSGNYLFDTNEYSDQFPASNDLSRLSSSQERPNTLPAGVWTPFSLTVTMKDNLTGAYSYDFFNMYYPAFQNKKIYYRNMQFEKNKGHKTPYVGQGGTRSSTESLLDLTKSTTIDVSNVSFNSTGQPTFDGTDDRVYIPNSTFTSPTELTIESVFKRTSTLPDAVGCPIHRNDGSNGNVGNSEFTIAVYRDNSYYIYGAIGANTGTATWTNGLTGVICEPDTYYHVASTWDGTNVRTYVNGDLKVTYSLATYSNSGGNIRFGASADNGGTYRWIGELPINKIYNRALTAQEVYNARRTKTTDKLVSSIPMEYME